MSKIPETLNPTAQTPMWRREVADKWRLMAAMVNQILHLYYQDAEPVIPVNTSALWVDTDAGPKYYLVANFGGTIKKVELT